jgi:hypothetical protein
MMLTVLPQPDGRRGLWKTLEAGAKNGRPTGPPDRRSFVLAFGSKTCYRSDEQEGGGAGRTLWTGSPAGKRLERC